MNKHNLLKRIASVATELDQSGFTKEAKNMDLILLKLAQSPVAAPGSDDDGGGYNGVKEVIEFLERMGESNYNIKKVQEGLNFINEEPYVHNYKIHFMGEKFDNSHDFYNFLADEYRKRKEEKYKETDIAEEGFDEPNNPMRGLFSL